jgi:hypothetical protein
MYNNSHGSPLQDDLHEFGGSLWTMPYLGNGAFGPATEIVHSSGENNFYPSYSPDGKFIAFNRVAKQAGAMTACANGFCPNDSFSNPKSRVLLLPTGGGITMPIDLEAANGSPAATPVDLSNSWPRWTPFVQTYKGSRLLWLTFSSTRDYGLRVRNHVMVGGQPQIQCYPSDSAELPGGAHHQPFADNCEQPQLWMAAINLSSAEVSTPGDPSYPAFWLPFQDITTHNHSAQWTQQVVNNPPPVDGGACIPAGADCTKDPTGCCNDAPTCTGNGTCGIL